MDLGPSPRTEHRDDLVGAETNAGRRRHGMCEKDGGIICGNACLIVLAIAIVAGPSSSVSIGGIDAYPGRFHTVSGVAVVLTAKP